MAGVVGLGLRKLRSAVGWPGSRQNSLFTITADTHEVRRNPEYYVMRHFSKYVRPGAKVLGATSHFNSMAIAFRNPDGIIVVVAQNALLDALADVSRETATVAFDIPVCDCTIVDADANRIVEPDEFELLIGHSSRRDDLKRTTFTVA